MEPYLRDAEDPAAARRRYLDEATPMDAFQRRSLYLSDANYRKRAERELARVKKEKPKTRQTVDSIEKALRKMDKEAGLWDELLKTPVGDAYRPPMSVQERRGYEYRDSVLQDAEARIAEAQREAARQLELLEDAQFRAAAAVAAAAAAPAAVVAEAGPAEPKPKRKPRAPIVAEAGPAEAGPADKPKRKPRAAKAAPADAEPADKPKRKPRAPKPVDRDAIRGKMTKSGGFRTTVYKDPSPAHPKKAYVGKAVETKGVRVAQNEEKPRAKKVAYAGTRSNFAKWFGL